MRGQREGMFAMKMKMKSEGGRESEGERGEVGDATRSDVIWGGAFEKRFLV